MGTPRRPQGLPRSGRERPRSDPGGSQERPRSVPGATFPATSAPEAAQRPPGSHFGAILESFWFNFHSFLLSFSPPRRRIFQRLQSHVSHMCAAFVSLFSNEPHAKATQTQIKNKAKQTQRTRKRERNTSKVRTTVAVTRGSSCLLLLRVRAFRPNADAGNGKRVRRMRTRVKSRFSEL